MRAEVLETLVPAYLHHHLPSGLAAETLALPKARTATVADLMVIMAVDLLTITVASAEAEFATV